MQATNPDEVFVASYPLDTVGIVRAANEIGLKTKLFGGGMVGLQITSIKHQLGPLMNGIVDYDFWIPAATMQFPGVLDFLKKYQARAAAEGVDPLGYYLALGLCLSPGAGPGGRRRQGPRPGQDRRLLRDNTFQTVVGDIKFGEDGEGRSRGH